MSAFQSQIISIDGMHGQQCVERITHALGDIRGVRVYGVKVGQAEILAESSCEEAIRTAVESQGFTVRKSVYEHKVGE